MRQMGTLDMPFFCVILHGDGIALEDETDTIIGFYTTRVVYANDKDVAVEKAKKKVLKEWTNGKYSKFNTGNNPRFDVDKIFEVGIWGAFFEKRSRSGYTFYTEN